MAAVFVLASSVAATPEPADGDGPSVPFRVGIFRTPAEPDLNEARANVKVFIEAVASRRGHPTEVDVVVYENSADFVDDLRQGRVDLISVPAEVYLEALSENLVEPRQVTVRNGIPGERLALIVPRGQEAASLEGLREARLVIEASHRPTLAKPWLDTLLLEAGLPPVDRYLGTVREVPTASQALFAVFFGQADSCVMNLPALATAVELNPQLGQRLVTFATSEPLASEILAVRRGYHSNIDDQLRQNLEDLGDDVEGRQLLTFFGVEKIVPFRPEFLDSTRDLLDRRRRLLSGRPELAAAGERVGGQGKARRDGDGRAVRSTR